jgi:8-oxo-dGTP pyrophosphatase MutT (NUDIX family)
MGFVANFAQNYIMDPTFCSKLKQRLLEPLPGELSHSKMANSNRAALMAASQDRSTARKSAVMILLFAEDAAIKFPLIRRTQGGKHSGQMALPGGKMEHGEDVFQTSIRETAEEIGVQVESACILGCLSEIYIPPSHSLVRPVVAYAQSRPSYRPQKKEVEFVVEASLHEIQSIQAVRLEKIELPNNLRITAPCFKIEGQIVWGATAMILGEFVDVLAEL